MRKKALSNLSNYICLQVSCETKIMYFSAYDIHWTPSRSAIIWWVKQPGRTRKITFEEFMHMKFMHDIICAQENRRKWKTDENIKWKKYINSNISKVKLDKSDNSWFSPYIKDDLLVVLHEVVEWGDPFNMKGLISLNCVSISTFSGYFPLSSCFCTFLVTQFCVFYLR